MASSSSSSQAWLASFAFVAFVFATSSIRCSDSALVGEPIDKLPLTRVEDDPIIQIVTDTATADADATETNEIPELRHDETTWYSHPVLASARDLQHAALFSRHVDADTFAEDGDGRLEWAGPDEKFYFYARVLAEIQEANDRNEPVFVPKRGDGQVALLPFSMVRRRIARAAGRMLVLAKEFDKIASDTGYLQATGGGLGVAGGLLTVAGLGLAPFTAGGSLALTGVSMSLAVGGTGTLVASAGFSIAGDVLESQWEGHYLDRIVTESNETLYYCDLLAGLLSESLVAFKNFDEYLDQQDLMPREYVEATLWIKNVLLTTMKVDTFVTLPKRLDIINDVIRAGKSVSKALAQSVDSFKVTLGARTVSFHRDLSKTVSQNAKVILRQVGDQIFDPTALKFSASGLKVPWYSGGQLTLKTVVSAGSKVAVALSLGGSLLSVATGIWSVLYGHANIKGSGILSDRIRRTVFDLDVHSSRTFELYDVLVMKDRTVDSGVKSNRLTDELSIPRPRILTGIEVHTCYAAGAESDSPVRLEVRSGNETCSTDVLETSGHNDLEQNQWDAYDSARVLGACAEFMLDPGEVVKVRFVNGGSGGHCGHLVNLQVDYLDTSHLTCQAPGGEAWSDEGPSPWLDCGESPRVSRVDVHTCLSDYAGTDSHVRMIMTSGDRFCLTERLDNNGNDLARGQVSYYRQDVLGKCAALDVVDDALKIGFIHLGSDALCLGNVFVHVKPKDPHQNAVIYRCDIPMQQNVELDISPFFTCRPASATGHALSPSAALGGVRPHVCDLTHAGSTTGFDYGVAFEFCHDDDDSDEGKKCCETNYLDVLYYDELTRGSSRLYSKAGAMGPCHGFDLRKAAAAGNMSFSVINSGGDALCLDGVDVYSQRGVQGLFPSARCHLPGPVWVEESTAGPFPCSTASTSTAVAQIVTQVCDVFGAGTDSALEFVVCRDASRQECCSTGALDTRGEDDFEKGDFKVYRRLGRQCSGFATGGDELLLSVVNRGSDQVCFSHLGVTTTDGRRLECYIPKEEEFWVDNGRMDLRCQRMG